VERLLLGDVRGSFYSSTVLQIGKFRVLVTSEVDGTSPREIDGISPLRTMDRVVEIKSSKKGIGTVLSNQGLPVQLTCNGSKHLAVVTVGVDHVSFPLRRITLVVCTCSLPNAFLLRCRSTGTRLWWSRCSG